MVRTSTLLGGMLAALVACGDDSSPTSAGSGGASASSASTGASPSTPSSSTSSTAPSSGTGGEDATSTGSAGGDATSTGSGGSGAGGEGPSAIGDVFRSGSRLRAIVRDGGGDARRWEGWYDAELDLECSVTTSEGVSRCLPTGHVVRFLDAECTQPVVEKEDCEPFPTHAARFVPSGVPCDASGSRYDTYRVIGEDEEVDALYNLSGDTCYASGVGPFLIRRTEPVDVETFVALEEIVEPVDDLLSRRVHTSPDGAMRALGGFDPGREEGCSVMDPPSADGVDRCVPYADRRYSGFAYWGDAACGIPAMPAFSCDEGSDAPIIDFQRDACGLETGTLHERGAPFAEHLHESFGSNPECLPQKSTFGVGLGPAIPLDGFPSLEVLTLAGDGVTMDLLGRAGRAVQSYGAWRGEDGVACYPRPFADGTTRCAPVGLGSASTAVFADDACTQPLARVGAFDPTCGVATVIAVTEDVDEECAETVVIDLVEAGPLHRGPLYALSGDDCAPLQSASLYAPLGDRSLGYAHLPPVELVIE